MRSSNSAWNTYENNTEKALLYSEWTACFLYRQYSFIFWFQSEQNKLVSYFSYAFVTVHKMDAFSDTATNFNI